MPEVNGEAGGDRWHFVAVFVLSLSHLLPLLSSSTFGLLISCVRSANSLRLINTYEFIALPLSILSPHPCLMATPSFIITACMCVCFWLISIWDVCLSTAQLHTTAGGRRGLWWGTDNPLHPTTPGRKTETPSVLNTHTHKCFSDFLFTSIYKYTGWNLMPINAGKHTSSKRNNCRAERKSHAGRVFVSGMACVSVAVQ